MSSPSKHRLVSESHGERSSSPERITSSACLAAVVRLVSWDLRRAINVWMHNSNSRRRSCDDCDLVLDQCQMIVRATQDLIDWHRLVWTQCPLLRQDSFCRNHVFVPRIRDFMISLLVSPISVPTPCLNSQSPPLSRHTVNTRRTVRVVLVCPQILAEACPSLPRLAIFG
jgi:hypothetical protein